MAEVDVTGIRILIVAVILACGFTAHAGTSRIKEIARVAGARDNALTGYGLVFGLAGSGDSLRNRATLQSVANTLRNFGVNVSEADLASRNVAAVIVTARLPAFAEPGQLLDVQVSSSGDARSLTGGTLMITPLYGPDGSLYAMAQGAISVGGYQFEGVSASLQKNHPTVGRIPSGATVEQTSPLRVAGDGRTISILLNDPDFTNAQRVVEAIQAVEPAADVRAEHAGKVTVAFAMPPANLVAEIARLENASVVLQRKSRVVVNERTGTVVAGGDVRLGAVSVSHGELKVEIRTDYTVSQPEGVFVRPGSSIASIAIPHTSIRAGEPEAQLVEVPEGATVADLVTSMRAIRLSTRDVIAVLQSIKAAGALDGELVIQ
ncbi:flagellar basal body P-ring protein FlgI [Marilutibacter alkalisoli]|uniref:Flagellar P-ring protein n=1 Tax=Marilutibacter alkalisoli TaxID=2591633 RepID=A0A514BRX8_9GAMM|nr:flagellar basal body P-ring protein FlgI [Lysobacter alkalisoli]QDH70152.1 flagellar basal body P-ring protein FlgI [Lysobacter alkalisoli]